MEQAGNVTSLGKKREIYKTFKPKDFKVNLMFAWPHIIDIINIDNQLDATIPVY